jgi:hypothetical protein
MIAALFILAVTKSYCEKLDLYINWENTNSLKVQGAVYPQSLNGLPKLSISIAQRGIKEIAIIKLSKTEYLGEFPIVFPEKPFETVSFRKMLDRGEEINFLDIIPVLYDSADEKYYLIRNLSIDITSYENGMNQNSNLRTGEERGSSLLASGDWYKIPVIQQGIYKIDYEYLDKAGLEMTSFNPKNIRIYGNGGGMLPQPNSEERPVGLLENAIFVYGQSDGIFNNDDYILFYGQSADHHQLLEDGSLEYEKNIYSDTTYYFLTIAENEGLRISENEDLGHNHTIITTYDDYLIYEKDEYNIINSGRMWFGEKFDFTSTYDLSFQISDLVENTEFSLTSSIMGQTYEESSMDIFVNAKYLGQQTIKTIPQGSYLVKGSLQTEAFRINTSEIPTTEELTIRLSYNPVGTALSKAYLDYLIIKSQRHLKLYGNQTHFRSLASIENAISTFKIENANSSTKIWDITDPKHPILQKGILSEKIFSFGALTGELKEFIAFNDSELLIPEAPRKINNQNLHATGSVDLLIVTHPEFLSEAERLADFRENHNGLTVQLVSVNEIYNEFSSGKQDVTAIRDYIKFIYDQGNNSDRIQSVLLFGKGSFDYKDRIDRNTNFVPIYSSRNSLHPISSYSSDDYFTFMDAEEGEWPESGNGNHLMDVGIGRLPVKTIEEARIVVDKLINYALNTETLGNWRNEIVYVADDGDNNLHQKDADKLATLVDTSYTQFNVNKIYIDAFEQVQTSIGETSPGAKEEFERSIDKGGLIVNFTGHGSPTRWTSETILNISSILELENYNRLPLFVTATCEFGRHENPKAISGAEYLLNNPEGGAIGLVTTSRPVYSSTNFILNQAFYNEVFEKSDGQYQTIGEIFRQTKNHPSNGLVNRNFALLADPSMTLAYAKDEIRIIADEAAYQPGDTLKALDKVKLKGQILSLDGTTNTNFNGELIATVYDKPSEIQTLGHEDPKMTFLSRNNIIFRGEASVIDGEFEIEFIVPKNIVYEFDKGKISLYAYDETTLQDASGSNIEFVVGGQSDDYEQDNNPPEIQLFINDSSFVEGGITGPDIKVLAYLQDESGISTSNSSEGKELTIILDDSLVVNVGSYYVAELDTYQRGWVTYPIKDLSIGTHKIQFMAWDVHNNYNEAAIEFNVIDGNEIKIESLSNYPNPFVDQTRFVFEHNRAGDDLEITIEILSVTGQLVKRLDYIEENSPGRITNILWDENVKGIGNFKAGLYIMRLGIRSLSDGSKSFSNHKFVKIN